MLARVIRRLHEAGVDDADRFAPALLSEQREINDAALASMISRRKVPQLLKSARRAGLLESDLLEALGIADHPVIRGALGAKADA